MSCIISKEIPQSSIKRLQLAFKNDDKNWRDADYCEHNCYSAAFFLLGVMTHEVLIFHKSEISIKDVFPFMQEVPKPANDSILFSYDGGGELVHASYIEKVNSLRGFHRGGKGSCLELFEDDFSKIEDYLSEAELKKPYIHRCFVIKDRLALEDWGRKVVANYAPYTDC